MAITNYNGIPWSNNPIHQVTPFTYSDGITMLHLVDAITEYLSGPLADDLSALVESVEDRLITTQEELDAALDEYLSTIEQRFGALAADAARVAVDAYLNSPNTVDSAVAGKINNPPTATRSAIDRVIGEATEPLVPYADLDRAAGSEVSTSGTDLQAAVDARAGVVFTNNFSGDVQDIPGLSNAVTALVQDSIENGGVSDWKGWLDASTSLDTITTPGRYGLSFDSSFGVAMLMVSTSGTAVMQDIFTGAGLWVHRTYSTGGGWTLWANVSGTERLEDTEDDPLDFSVLTTGAYQVTRAVDIEALNIPTRSHGALHVSKWPVGASVFGVAYYVTRQNPPTILATNLNTDGTAVGWEKIAGTERLVTSTHAPLVFSSLSSGDYQVTRSADAAALNLPTTDHGVLRVDRWTTAGGRPGMAMWTTKPTALGATELWTTEIDNEGEAVRWTLATGSGRGVVSSGSGDMGTRHVYVSDRHAAAIGAPVKVGTATPVAMTWDDYPADFKRHGLDAIAREYGIPMTLAIPSSALDAGYEALKGTGEVTWSEIDSWVAEGIVELANHSATHRSLVPDDELENEIVGSLDRLRQLSPSGDISTWVMPDNAWSGLDEGRTADGWASRAGQLIMGHHAFATGKDSVRSDHAVPMTGRPFHGANRRWIEAPGLTDQVRQNLVASSYGSNRGVILGAHPAWIGQGDRWNIEQVETFFQWLAGERDAGRVAPMFLSRFPWAVVG